MATTPTAEEQLLLEQINRFRANPAAEADILIGTGALPSVLSAINYFGVSTTAFRASLAALSPAAPVAWNANLANAAAGHNQVMITADEQTHQAAGELGLGARITAAGYNWTSLGENVYAFANDVVHGHAGFIIDWGYDKEDYDGTTLLSDWRTRGDGIQDPAGHLNTLINANYTEVGISVVAETNPQTSVGPKLITEDFGRASGYKAQFVGVVIDDKDKDAFYDIGEGQANVTLTFVRQGDGATYTTTTWSSGGFQIVAPSGTYNVTASGGDLVAPVSLTATIGSANVHLTVIEGAAAAAPAATLPIIQTQRAGDYNGDGRDDIIWRNDAGLVSNWLGQASGGFVSNDAKSLSAVPVSWKIVGTGDFNGDGRADLIWRNDSGTFSDWLGQANGGFVSNDAVAMRNVPTNWKVVGTGDFNGDGRDDVLWRNDSGQFSDWLGQANGGFVSNDANALTTVATNWHVVGTGDFNGDGRDDVLWRNDSGQFSEWLGQANGGFVNNDAKASRNVPTSWKVAGTGDFNGDSRDDVLWRNDNGTLTNWLGQADGSFLVNDAKASTVVPTSWQVAGTGDFNGDGRDDVLWRNSAGAVSDWLGRADGSFASNDANAMASVMTNWQISLATQYL
ncbi:FG-GAP-like repeat-containing protein [Novosphingobium sp. JCM 18896]|uniref:FG-GAP-like repeat-containing protein n=1 Tax=Novosphingobium sp. JCM 18896 TaxID=2989731 RepID=UPI0022234696|nr:FG-GAP-like repeat-containing protein [Novosphingobium sp. JCM 18896]MCW1429995.1 FG-GAP-like repeat-containing protein [Novosphingobium sp. JCM 18896]